MRVVGIREQTIPISRYSDPQIPFALGLGGSESNPHNFQPFGGFADGARVGGGFVRLPEAPGIGFETRSALYNVSRSLTWERRNEQVLKESKYDFVRSGKG